MNGSAVHGDRLGVRSDSSGIKGGGGLGAAMRGYTAPAVQRLTKPRCLSQPRGVQQGVPLSRSEARLESCSSRTLAAAAAMPMPLADAAQRGRSPLQMVRSHHGERPQSQAAPQARPAWVSSGTCPAPADAVTPSAAGVNAVASAATPPRQEVATVPSNFGEPSFCSSGGSHPSRSSVNDILRRFRCEASAIVRSFMELDVSQRAHPDTVSGTSWLAPCESVPSISLLRSTPSSPSVFRSPALPATAGAASGRMQALEAGQASVGNSAAQEVLSDGWLLPKAQQIFRARTSQASLQWNDGSVRAYIHDVFGGTGLPVPDEARVYASYRTVTASRQSQALDEESCLSLVRALAVQPLLEEVPPILLSSSAAVAPPAPATSSSSAAAGGGSVQSLFSAPPWQSQTQAGRQSPDLDWLMHSKSAAVRSVFAPSPQEDAEAALPQGASVQLPQDDSACEAPQDSINVPQHSTSSAPRSERNLDAPFESSTQWSVEQEPLPVHAAERTEAADAPADSAAAPAVESWAQTASLWPEEQTHAFPATALAVEAAPYTTPLWPDATHMSEQQIPEEAPTTAGAAAEEVSDAVRASIWTDAGGQMEVPEGFPPAISGSSFPEPADAKSSFPAGSGFEEAPWPQQWPEVAPVPPSNLEAAAPTVAVAAARSELKPEPGPEEENKGFSSDAAAKVDPFGAHSTAQQVAAASSTSPGADALAPKFQDVSAVLAPDPQRGVGACSPSSCSNQPLAAAAQAEVLEAAQEPAVAPAAAALEAPSGGSSPHGVVKDSAVAPHQALSEPSQLQSATTGNGLIQGAEPHALERVSDSLASNSSLPRAASIDADSAAGGRAESDLAGSLGSSIHLANETRRTETERADASACDQELSSLQELDEAEHELLCARAGLDKFEQEFLQIMSTVERYAKKTTARPSPPSGPRVAHRPLPVRGAMPYKELVGGSNGEPQSTFQAGIVLDDSQVFKPARLVMERVPHAQTVNPEHFLIGTPQDSSASFSSQWLQEASLIGR